MGRKRNDNPQNMKSIKNDLENIKVRLAVVEDTKPSKTEVVQLIFKILMLIAGIFALLKCLF